MSSTLQVTTATREHTDARSFSAYCSSSSEERNKAESVLFALTVRMWHQAQTHRLHSFPAPKNDGVVLVWGSSTSEETPLS
jgi:hypothetical protein